MIEVTRFDGSRIFVNPDLIELIEANPDTVISLTTQKKLVVRESPEELLARIIAYKREIGVALPPVRTTGRNPHLDEGR